jgi:thiamine-monophosphate kinase
MEAEFLSWLRTRLSTHPALELGVGDDAAILRLAAGSSCVVTSDTLNEGVDFHRDQLDWHSIGRKALAVNLSDLAAMAAVPLAALVSLTVPRSGALEIARGLYEGLLPLAGQFQTAIAGGDYGSWDGPLVITVTAIGQTTQRPSLTRAGAKPGDEILVTGSFGGSIQERHWSFTPRVHEALLLNENYRIHAATDVSDGLSLDLSHITMESRCGALLDLAAIPIAPAAQQVAERGIGARTALDHALADGEDFELILAVPADEADRLLADQPLDVPLTRIGAFVEAPGLWSLDGRGRRQRLQPAGYVH